MQAVLKSVYANQQSFVQIAKIFSDVTCWFFWDAMIFCNSPPLIKSP